MTLPSLAFGHPAMTLPAARAVLLLAMALGSAAAARADADHDHAEAAAAAPAAARPRFVASSAHYELVGVLQGRQLTLYLDHAASNEAVQQARLELTLGGRTLSPVAQGEGEFVLMLDAPPAHGHTPITATVSADGQTDQLSGELDIDDDVHADEAPAHGPRRWAVWGAAALAALLALGLSARRLMGRRARRQGARA